MKGKKLKLGPAGNTKFGIEKKNAFSPKVKGLKGSPSPKKMMK